VDVQAERIAGIVQDIATIKWLMVFGLGMLAVFVAAALFGVYLLYLSVAALREQQAGKIFRLKAEDLIAKAQYDELISDCMQRLQTHPNDVWTHWYLGQAYYYKKTWIDSKRSFRRVLELEPGWYSSVDSFLERVERAIRESGPRLVE